MKFNCLSDAYSSVKFSRLAILNNVNKVNIIVDTGASIPVWTDTPEMLQRYYKDAEKLNVIVELSGFGGAGEDAELWRIPEFKLSDGNESVTYKDLLVAVSPTEENISFIMSFNMLTNTELIFEKRTPIDTPVLYLNFSKSLLKVVPSYLYTTDGGKEALGRTSVFYQEASTAVKERKVAELLVDTTLCEELKDLGVKSLTNTFLNIAPLGITQLSNEDIIKKVKEAVTCQTF